MNPTRTLQYLFFKDSSPFSRVLFQEYNVGFIDRLTKIIMEARRMKSVVAYYSKTGNTKFVAEKIANRLQADLCEIKDKKNRKGIWGFLTGSLDARREKLTEIETSRSIEDYELVVVGSPVWFGKMTPATRTFIVNNNFSKKKVAFFLTLGGNKPENPMENMKKTVDISIQNGDLALNKVLEQREETIAKITKWCKELPKPSTT